jgi:hypothetical protein
MATIRKLPSGRFQAVVRLKGMKPLYATFPSKSKAKLWAKAVEDDTALARKLTRVPGELLFRPQPGVETGRHNASPTRNVAAVQVARQGHRRFQRACRHPVMHAYVNGCNTL